MKEQDLWNEIEKLKAERGRLEQQEQSLLLLADTYKAERDKYKAALEQIAESKYEDELPRNRMTKHLKNMALAALGRRVLN